MSASDSIKKKLVVVGAGFGGLGAVKKLSHREDLEITLIDRHNYHLFQPLLYQVAMSGLSVSDIAAPIRNILADHENVQIFWGEVLSVDLKNKKISTDFTSPENELNFDYLLLACGSQHSYFGNEQWEPDAPGLKTLEQANEVRRRVLSAFEMAEREEDIVRLGELLTFVVVGGGPTGVELAGSLGEICHHALHGEFQHINPKLAQIILLEAGPKILATFDDKLSAHAVSDLEELGVTVRTSAKVLNISSEGVQLENEFIKAATVIWGAGVKPASLNQHLSVALDKTGRVLVEPDLSVPGYPNVFVIGDQAAFLQKGKALPGVAPVAIQQGKKVSENIKALLDGRPTRPFKYLDKGQLATIGRSRAVMQSGKIKISGRLAWWAWLVVHIFYLVGYRNRVVVIIKWAWSYLTYRRSDQLILNREWQSFKKEKS
jgi:NADH dehydrogenase